MTDSYFIDKFSQAKEAASAKRFDESAQLLNELISNNCTDICVLDLLGYVEYFRGNIEAAEKCCRDALAQSETHVYALKGLGLCLAKQKKVDEGITYLRKAIALNPGYADARWDLAVVLTNAGRYAEAQKVLRQAAVDIPSRMIQFTTFIQKIESTLRSSPSRLSRDSGSQGAGS